MRWVFLGRGEVGLPAQQPQVQGVSRWNMPESGGRLVARAACHMCASGHADPGNKVEQLHGDLDGR